MWMCKFLPTSNMPSGGPAFFLGLLSPWTGIPWTLPDSFLLSQGAAWGLEEPAPSTDVMKGDGNKQKDA